MSGAGRGRVRSISGYQVERLSEGWGVASCPPDAIDGPAALAAASLEWLPALVPSTAASALRAAGRWSLEDPPRKFDAEDWWYRTSFRADPAEPGEQIWLCFDGLATISDVWLNGEPLLCSAGMFTAREHRVDQQLRAENHLAIRFRSLDSLLAARRPRPRWRAPMVEHQQLRWHRTTLLGRTPGWSPPAAAVGPWRPVRLERRRGVIIQDVRLLAHGSGALDVSCRVATLSGETVSGAEIIVERDGRTYGTALNLSGSGEFSATLQVPDAELWWPHTHGDPALYSARLRLGRAREIIEVDLGAVGFRSVSLETAGDDFEIRVNSVPIFCRGACWTPLDPVSLGESPGTLDQAMTQVVAAGMNMLRVGGTMVYQSDDFLDACDSRGILLWQDFMFANMDYPEDDKSFIAAVDIEIRQELGRLQGRPSVAVLCGNSEGGQQAAMWGATRDRWTPALFHRLIPDLVAAFCSGVPYAPSSAFGGAFPHQASTGATSYYGVGAYRRPLEDARRAEVRFASECLAFANVPTAQSLAASPVLRGARVHHSAWKGRTPRDPGAGWDFDDVRDHYLALLFGVDPLELRASDHERYLSLSRVVTGEVMAAVFGEWRRRRSTTRGGLVWFLRDLWDSAGWGVIDASGKPKAAWHYLRRALAPVALFLSDEGGNGIGVHLTNDTPLMVEGDLEIALFRGAVPVTRGHQAVSVAPHDSLERNAADWFDSLHDLSYAYRFGPPAYDLMAATVRDGSGSVIARACHFIQGLPRVMVPEIGLTAEARRKADGYELVVRTRDFAQSVTVELEGYTSEDNFFHLAPGEERVLEIRPDGSGASARGTLKPLNSEMATPVSFPGNP
ncbi:MAG: glycoside hydrolase family 2 protein [Gemmatimonadota bacterium]